MIEYVLGALWGIFVGFAIAVPVGPVGLVCIQRTLAKGRASGLISGLGAAIADIFLASIGAFSITAIFVFIKHHESLLQILGGSLLFFLGIMSLISKPKPKEIKIDTTLDHIEEFLSAFVLTVTNPLSVFTFFIAFGAISSKIGGELSVAVTFVAGVFIGSCLWWMFLTYIADRIAHKINQDHIKSINKWFSITIALIGIAILMGVLLR